MLRRRGKRQRMRGKRPQMHGKRSQRHGKWRQRHTNSKRMFGRKQWMLPVNLRMRSKRKTIGRRKKTRLFWLGRRLPKGTTGNRRLGYPRVSRKLCNFIFTHVFTTTWRTRPAGREGVLGAISKCAIAIALEAKLTHHTGYAPHSAAGRNGCTEKHQRRMGGLFEAKGALPAYHPTSLHQGLDNLIPATYTTKVRCADSKRHTTTTHT